jgi:cell division protein FtsQ
VKKNIRRIITVSLWLLAGALIIVLSIAAVNARTQQVCKGYEIDIKGDEEGKWFIDRSDVVNVITENKKLTLKNKPIRSFDLNRIETRLKKEPWIKDAELFFDNNGILKVIVEERKPIARIFSSSGGSFYIDSTGQRLPLSPKVSARVPVFTGYPIQSGKTRTASDKKLVREIKDLSVFLLGDPFWMAQISQIDITHAREFEMVPTVGNHVIEFGDGRDAEKKFSRLMVFYRQVLAKTGMEKYERIKVQYNNQIIGVKKQ